MSETLQCISSVITRHYNGIPFWGFLLYSGSTP